MSFRDELVRLRACQDAIDWVGKRTLEQAWCECENLGWLVWLLYVGQGKPGWPTDADLFRAAIEMTYALRCVALSVTEWPEVIWEVERQKANVLFYGHERAEKFVARQLKQHVKIGPPWWGEEENDGETGR